MGSRSVPEFPLGGERAEPARMNGVDLLNRPVLARGIQLGRVVDVILDQDDEPIGLEVLCGDEERRFVPVAAAPDP